MINVKDANGNWVVLKECDLLEAISKAGWSVYGISLKAILAFRRGFVRAVGTSNITEERVEKFFEIVAELARKEK